MAITGVVLTQRDAIRAAFDFGCQRDVEVAAAWVEGEVPDGEVSGHLRLGERLAGSGVDPAQRAIAADPDRPGAACRGRDYRIRV